MLASTVGASYATVTACPLPTAEESVSITVDVAPLAATDETVTGEPLTRTVNALGRARGSRRVSL